MNEVLQTIKNRRSIRSYKPEQIKQEELDLILEAGIYAPSGHNAQPWHFTVIQNPEVINYINDTAKQVMATMDIDWIRHNGMNPKFHIAYNAPTLVIVSGKKDAVTSKTDCDAATQNMMLAAESLNIGSVWVGFALFSFKIEGVAEKISIPEGYEPYYGVALGYKAQDTQPNAPKRNYDVVHYIR